MLTLLQWIILCVFHQNKKQKIPCVTDTLLRILSGVVWCEWHPLEDSNKNKRRERERERKRESEEVVASVLVFMLVNDLKGILCHFIRSSQVGIERGLFSLNLVENWFLTSFLLFLVLGFGMGFLTIVIPYLFFKIKNKNCCLPIWVV